MKTRVFPTLFVLLLAVGAFVPSGGAASQSPTLSLHGKRLRWTAVEASRSYKLLARTAVREKISTVRGRSIVPPIRPGETVIYRVKAYAGTSPWSNAVSVTYPPAGKEPGEESSPPLTVGVNAGGWGGSAFADIAHAVKSVRLEARFASDAEVGAAAAAHVRVGTWLLGGGGSIAAIDPATYASEVITLFKRYGKGGTFWKGRADLGGQAVEILNEPGNPYFWKDAETAQGHYIAIVKAVQSAVAAAFPASLRPTLLVSYDGGFAGDTYGESLTAMEPNLFKLEGVRPDVHPYGGHGSNSALGGRDRVTIAHADTGLPVYVTEVGWPTAAGQPATGDSLQWTEAQQASNIVEFVRWSRSLKYVATVDVFDYIDYGSNDWYGIERRDRSHKPAFAALAGA